MKRFILLISCLWITIVSFVNKVVINTMSLIACGELSNYNVQFNLRWIYGGQVLTGKNNYNGCRAFYKYSMGGATGSILP